MFHKIKEKLNSTIFFSLPINWVVSNSTVLQPFSLSVLTQIFMWEPVTWLQSDSPEWSCKCLGPRQTWTVSCKLLILAFTALTTLLRLLTQLSYLTAKNQTFFFIRWDIPNLNHVVHVLSGLDRENRFMWFQGESVYIFIHKQVLLLQRRGDLLESMICNIFLLKV